LPYLIYIFVSDRKGWLLFCQATESCDLRLLPVAMTNSFILLDDIGSEVIVPHL
jgi:hypothetical protein